jgi:hypothetical protein
LGAGGLAKALCAALDTGEQPHMRKFFFAQEHQLRVVAADAVFRETI